MGLLQVADGALSQVTNLLNRAVTLATEASNGTLNSSQESAANQEYQSILSEINNIGSTTTYNQNQVFTGSVSGVAIYTGDSSSAGASVDSLFFGTLSSSTLGDTGGSVQQNSNGQFVDLSKDAAGVADYRRDHWERRHRGAHVHHQQCGRNDKDDHHHVYDGGRPDRRDQ